MTDSRHEAAVATAATAATVASKKGCEIMFLKPDGRDVGHVLMRACLEALLQHYNKQGRFQEITTATNRLITMKEKGRVVNATL